MKFIEFLKEEDEDHTTPFQRFAFERIRKTLVPQGEKAYQEGQSHKSNPYQKGTFRWLGWHLGWEKAYKESGKSLTSYKKTLGKEYYDIVFDAMGRLDRFQQANRKSHDADGIPFDEIEYQSPGYKGYPVRKNWEPLLPNPKDRRPKKK